MREVSSILRIFMFGGIKIFVGDRDITNEFPLKSLSVLCYLAYNKNTEIKRSKLVYMFWNDSSEEAARYNLRYNLWCIRKILRKYICNDTFIISQSQSTCQFNCNTEHYIDTFEFLTLCKEEKEACCYEKAGEIYKGDFLEDYCVKGSPEFDNWVFFERERLQEMLLSVLNWLSNLYIKEGNKIKSIDCLEKMLSFNELQEEIYIELMKQYISNDDMPSAERIYKRYSKIMREELNLPPNAEAQKVFLITNASNTSKQAKIIVNDKCINRKTDILDNYIINIDKHLFITADKHSELCRRLKGMNYVYYTFYRDSSVENENIFEFMSYVITNNLSYIKKNVSKEYLNNIYCVIPGIGYYEQTWAMEFGAEYRFFYSSYKVMEELTHKFQILLFINNIISEGKLNAFIAFLEQRLAGKIKKIYIK